MSTSIAFVIATAEVFVYIRFRLRNFNSKIIDSLSITASIVDITIVVIESVKFLHIIISDIKDVSTALENIRSNLKIVESSLQKLLIGLKSEDSKVLLIDDIKGVIENCNSACSTFKDRLDHLMRHAIKHKAF